MFKGLTKYSLLKCRFNIGTEEAAMHGLYIEWFYLMAASLVAGRHICGKKEKTKLIWWDFEPSPYNFPNVMTTTPRNPIVLCLNH